MHVNVLLETRKPSSKDSKSARGWVPYRRRNSV